MATQVSPTDTRDVAPPNPHPDPPHPSRGPLIGDWVCCRCDTILDPGTWNPSLKRWGYSCHHVDETKETYGYLHQQPVKPNINPHKAICFGDAVRTGQKFKRPIKCECEVIECMHVRGLREPGTERECDCWQWTPKEAGRRLTLKLEKLADKMAEDEKDAQKDLTRREKEREERAKASRAKKEEEWNLQAQQKKIAQQARKEKNKQRNARKRAAKKQRMAEQSKARRLEEEIAGGKAAEDEPFRRAVEYTNMNDTRRARRCAAKQRKTEGTETEQSGRETDAIESTVEREGCSNAPTRLLGSTAEASPTRSESNSTSSEQVEKRKAKNRKRNAWRRQAKENKTKAQAQIREDGEDWEMVEKPTA